MGMTSEHKQLIREHFRIELGSVCASCGTAFNLEFHHKEPIGDGEGRGSSKRVWELFTAYHKGNLELLCKQCHIELHRCKDYD